MLALILLDLVLIGTLVRGYLPFLRQPQSIIYWLEPVVLLISYGIIVVWLTHHPSRRRQTALQVGTWVGLITGLLWIINLASETFRARSDISSTAPFLLGGFALWGVAGFLSTRRTNTFTQGIVAAIWAAMLTVLLSVTFGFVLGLVAEPRLEQLMIGDPDFLRSGWQDRHAFTIANQFDSGFSHLGGALIIGSLVGTLGAAVGTIRSRSHGGRLAT